MTTYQLWINGIAERFQFAVGNDFCELKSDEMQTIARGVQDYKEEVKAAQQKIHELEFSIMQYRENQEAMQKWMNEQTVKLNKIQALGNDMKTLIKDELGGHRLTREWETYEKEK